MMAPHCGACRFYRPATDLDGMAGLPWFMAARLLPGAIGHCESAETLSEIGMPERPNAGAVAYSQTGRPGRLWVKPTFGCAEFQPAGLAITIQVVHPRDQKS